MANIVILKNNTGLQTTIEDLGISLSASEVYQATDYFEFVELTESDDLKVFVGAGDITVNDGSDDLSVDKGLEHLEIESIHQDYIQDSEIGGGVVSTDTAVTGALRSTQFQVPTSFTSTSYESPEYQNLPDVLEWSASQPERITVKEDGVYRVSTCYFVRANSPNFIDTYFQITVNGVAYGSESNLNTYVSEIQQALLCFSVPLTAGDYVESQCRCDTGNDIDIMGSRFNAYKLEGVEGPAGPAGGTTIKAKQEGVLIQDNVDVLNFRGDGVTVTAGATGVAYIDINSSGVFEPRYIQVYDSAGLVDINDDTATSIPFDTQEIRDTDTFDHSTSTNNSRIYILRTGWFEVSWTITYEGDNSRKVVLGALRKNGSTLLDRTIGAAYTRNNTDDYGAPNSAGTLVYLTTGDYVELIGLREGSSGSVDTIPNTCRATLKMIREG